MSWPNPFTRRDENTRSFWGYTFQWTKDHLTAEQLHPLKFTYDVLGEECLDRLDKISPPDNASVSRNQRLDSEKSKQSQAPKRDLYSLLRDNEASDEKLSELWKEVTQIPEWVDWDQIERGQQVFYRYGGPALTALAYQSLLGGMAAARVTEVLARTGGFSPKVAQRRMYETTQHILQCTSSLDSIKPGGEGFAASIRVRLLHAAVRRRILTLAKQRPSYYSVEDYGIPINDLDCIGTISTFSTTLIWLGFPRQGIYLRKAEREDYQALWRLVAHYMGTPTDVFESENRAKSMMESLLASEINPSEMSKVMANNIILSLQNIPPSYPSRQFLVASARWLNGDELGDELGLDRPNIYYKALVAGQCLFFIFLCYTHRSIDYLDRRKIKALRTMFYQFIIASPTHGLGEETNFEFKYIPQFDTTTTTSEDAQDVENALSRLRRGGVERRNLKALVIAASLIGLIGLVGIKISFATFRVLKSMFERTRVVRFVYIVQEGLHF